MEVDGIAAVEEVILAGHAQRELSLENVEELHARVKIWRADRAAAWLFAPYPGWVTLAAVLNIEIWG